MKTASTGKIVKLHLHDVLHPCHQTCRVRMGPPVSERCKALPSYIRVPKLHAPRLPLGGKETQHGGLVKTTIIGGTCPFARSARLGWQLPCSAAGRAHGPKQGVQLAHSRHFSLFQSVSVSQGDLSSCPFTLHVPHFPVGPVAAGAHGTLRRRADVTTPCCANTLAASTVYRSRMTRLG